MNRIMFNDIGSAAGAYSVILNPISVDVGDKANTVNQETDDGIVIDSKYTRNDIINIKWSNIRQNYPGFASMLATLYSYLYEVKYLNLASIDYGVFCTGWLKCRVLDLDIKLSPVYVGGMYRYDVNFILQREK